MYVESLEETPIHPIWKINFTPTYVLLYVILESQLIVGIVGKFLYNTHFNQNAWRQATLQVIEIPG